MTARRGPFLKVRALVTAAVAGSYEMWKVVKAERWLKDRRDGRAARTDLIAIYLESGKPGEMSMSQGSC